jgi:hypothetical protein
MAVLVFLSAKHMSAKALKVQLDQQVHRDQQARPVPKAPQDPKAHKAILDLRV